MNPEQVSRYMEIWKVKDRIADQFLARPGVNGIGVGFKETGGRQTDTLAIIFYVGKKRDVGEVEALPAIVEGIPTDVVEFEIRRNIPSRPKAQRAPAADSIGAVDVDDDKYDPLVGGIAIGLSREVENRDHERLMAPSGTLGLMVADAENGVPMMLSNYHVMCGEDGHARRGDEICQPGRQEAILRFCSNCAELKDWHVGGVTVDRITYGIDAAVAVQTHRETSFGDIVDIGRVSTMQLATPAMINNDVVVKQGFVSGRTEGMLTDVAFDLQQDFGPPYNQVTLRNQIRIRPNAPGNFLDRGDSGSVLVLRDRPIVIGLNWAGGNNGDGVASQILAVRYQLNFLMSPLV